MTDRIEIDLDTFPTGVDVPSTLESSGGNDAAMTLIQFQFCLTFAGRPWQTVSIAAPSPEEAAITMAQYVSQVLNPTLVRMGYPSGICSFNPGECPL